MAMQTKARDFREAACWSGLAVTAASGAMEQVALGLAAGDPLVVHGHLRCAKSRLSEAISAIEKAERQLSEIGDFR